MKLIMSWKDYLDANFSRYVEELIDLVHIPSVSALPERSRDVRDAAEWVARRLQAAGVENTVVLPTGGHPVVYGDWLHAGDDRVTVLIYGHFDVQPADPLDKWETPAFEPALKGDRLYGRGASDDKGGLMTSIMGVEALLQTEGSLPVNVKFCYEGQEEIGSPQLDAFLSEQRERFACDLVLSADGLLWSPDQPMIVLGLRGLCSLEIHVKGPSSDLHSGLHGGVLRNPIEALSELIASLRAPDGRIAVKGFFDDVVELPDETRAEIGLVPFDGDAYLKELGITGFFGEPGYSTRERNWIRPTLELNGIWGGFSGEGTKTVIPSEAHAKITCRLAANQDPDRIVAAIRAHVEENTPAGVKATVAQLSARADTYLMSAEHPGNVIASEILTSLYDGHKPYQVYVGGSIPITTYFRRYLGADTINFGWSAGDENLHAPNEFFRLRNFRRGAAGYCRMLKRLGQENAGSLRSL